MHIAVCLAWADLHPDVEPLTGSVTRRERSYGLSAADEAALEWALRLAQPAGGTVLAVTVGPVGAEAVLRTALAAGATSAVRVEAAMEAPTLTVARELAEVVAEVDLVICGDHGSDRASGAVPAFLAGLLERAQGLGLLDVSITPTAPGALSGLRRLDGGRRERLRIPLPAVISVEGATATLRRAALREVLAAEGRPIVSLPAVHSHHHVHERTTAYRPRPRTRPAPVGDEALDRVRSLIGITQVRTPPRRLRLDADEAARTIVEQLQAWGYTT